MGRLTSLLVQPSRRRHFFITTPIFYANAPPHIGHLYSALIADCAYRWNKLKDGLSSDGPSCSIFSVGTDEHGTKIQKTADLAGISPKIFCDSISSKFNYLFKHFNVCPTDFIRTSDERHRQAVQHAWKLISERGLIEKGKYCGWYSMADECFYSENEVESSFENGVKMVISKSTRSVVEWVEEENYLFQISKFYEPIRQWLTQNDIVRPKQYLPIALQYLDTEEKLSVSRDRKRLSWGIPVPGDPTQTIYVWMDALINYLTVSGFPDSRQTCWPPTWQIIGKDILKFHAIFWPAFLMAAQLPLPEKLFVHGHWLVNRVKMSKSTGNIVDPFVTSEKLSVDGLRYFLLRQGTPHDDANFTMSKAVNVVNTDLVNNLANLLQRASTRKLNPKQIYPAFHLKLLSGDLNILANSLIENLNQLRDQCMEHYNSMMIYKSLDSICAAARQTNVFFQLSQAWKLDSSEKLSTILHLVYEAVRICNILLQPVVPEYATRSLDRLGIREKDRCLEEAVFGGARSALVGNTLGNTHEHIMERVILP